MGAKYLKYAWAGVPILFLVSFSIVFYFAPPASIIGWVGVDNAYLLIFILGLVGGLSTFVAIPYHLVLITLALGGLNPFLLGTVTAVGVMLGDSTSYYLGRQGRQFIPAKAQAFLERLKFLEAKYPRLLPLIFLAYGALIPFPNDLITIPAGVMHYSFIRTLVPLAIGNLIFNIGIALLAVYAYDFLQTLPFIT
jgi:membrane protein YqaA with SNARE-associated domain